VGVQVPLRAPTKQKTYKKITASSRAAIFVCWLYWWRLVLTVRPAAFCRLLSGCSGDLLDDGQPARRREVAVAGRHVNRLVTCCSLNSLDGRSGHCQPGAKRLPVRMLDIACDHDIFQTGLKPRARVVAFTGTRKDGISGALSSKSVPVRLLKMAGRALQGTNL
jgi:hypothetical protein